MELTEAQKKYLRRLKSRYLYSDTSTCDDFLSNEAFRKRWEEVVVNNIKFLFIGHDREAITACINHLGIVFPPEEPVQSPASATDDIVISITLCIIEDFISLNYGFRYKTAMGRTPRILYPTLMGVVLVLNEDSTPEDIADTLYIFQLPMLAASMLETDEDTLRKQLKLPERIPILPLNPDSYRSVKTVMLALIDEIL